ncbi:S-adenosyl-L-methionine-dependent methyltransferase [Truncatella angustata]|uniref:S-adenosyl-L-methionine-dependent methyltransferase n=1 Tax=Truncatella angustata TaxID=152316 RepID=A0A9P8ZZI5_9PEZI|nr:S-adenosyl-L-methionine-dependent methyltransferase [Truncatella angustata]KAH6656078.1 S-adenosyl-L-methionine-dependent methyltransferase [Truncatella angustata]
MSHPFSMAQFPILPSQLLNSYNLVRPPPQLFAEQKPVAAKNVSNFITPTVPSQMLPPRDPDFAKIANDLINKALDRKPGGSSVVEPDSVLDESGRLYHGYKEGKYLLPNDAAYRLDLQHAIFRIMFNGWLALAPFSSPPKFVLDIGTGTGIWAAEFAQQNPFSYVVGTDLSAIQPVSSLRNLIFAKDDAEEPWYFPHPDPDHSQCHGHCEHWVKFDYVHLRMMLTCFDDTRTVMKHAFQNLNPGGWIEFQDTAMEFFQANQSYSGDAIMRCAEGLNRGLAAIGRDGKKAWYYERWLKEIGFVDVVHRQCWIPITPWAADPKFKKMGAFNQSNLYDGVRGISWKLLRAAGMPAEQIEKIVNESRCIRTQTTFVKDRPLEIAGSVTSSESTTSGSPALEPSTLAET